MLSIKSYNKAFTLYGIIKFGQKKYIEELYKNGIVYMQRAENYTHIEHNERGDKNENLTHLFQSNQIKSFRIDDEEFKIIDNIKIKLSNRKNPFVFSSFAITENQFQNGKNIINKEMLKFGDTALLITDFDKFFNLIKKNINKNDVLSCNLVEYINEKEYNGRMSIFKKLKQYQHQNEHRIVIETLNNNEKKFKIPIGSLKDIAHIFSSKELLDSITLD